jgi:membrane-associated phospholipid phosphatase
LLVSVADVPVPAPTSLAAPEPPPTAAPAPPPPAPEPPPTLSIYEVHLAIDLPVSALGASLGLMRVYFRDALARKSCPCDPAGLNALDRGTVGNHSHAASIAADATVYATMVAPVLADLLDVGASRAFAEDLIVFVETLEVGSGVQNAVNLAVSRPRPLTYAGDPKFVTSGEGYLSFYAGHVATAFSALSAASFTLGRRHGQRVWPWIVTAVVAGSVGVDRIASGHHFPTDVAVGAVVGIAIGITVPWLHLRSRPVPVTVAPSALGPGLALMGRF